ncbi:MAG: DUF6503 family protein [Bacteroidota bacterium]
MVKEAERPTIQVEHPILAQVIAAHGGMENWKRMHTLSYEIPKDSGTEKHTIDLHSRKDRIQMGDIAMGYNGDTVWVLDEKGDYKGNPDFYHNLMFYFFAMPFVLTDPGIQYGKTRDLIVDGEAYPGISIGYDAGIGASPKDEYFLHFDPVTHTMAWLGYTATFGSDETSKKVNWIRYSDWAPVKGVLLPRSITWYDHEDREIGEPRSTVKFENITLERTSKPLSFYENPNGGQQGN